MINSSRRTEFETWWFVKLSESALCFARAFSAGAEGGVEVLRVAGLPREPLDPSALEAVAPAARDHVMPPAAGLAELRQALAAWTSSASWSGCSD